MSNVLIGIIGVILFIGLALAGALFLGPRFQESVSNSKGSATVQGVAQVASAANMQNVDTGVPVQAGAPTGLQSGGYLKDIPANPVSGGTAATLLGAAGATSGDAKYVTMQIPSTSQQVCEAIARQSGQPATDVTTGLAAFPTKPSGCFKATAAIGTTISSGNLVAFAAI